jgi:hypothetical protein
MEPPVPAFVEPPVPVPPPVPEFMEPPPVARTARRSVVFRLPEGAAPADGLPGLAGSPPPSPADIPAANPAVWLLERPERAGLALGLALGVVLACALALHYARPSKAGCCVSVL